MLFRSSDMVHQQWFKDRDTAAQQRPGGLDINIFWQWNHPLPVRTQLLGKATAIHNRRHRTLLAVDLITANTGVAVTTATRRPANPDTLTDLQTEVFERLFSSISLIERVDSAHMGIGMCIAGCAPAFTDMYIEALGDAGVKYGLQRATAYRLAAKMVEGVGALYLKNETHPGVMKDAVCSPGGTTIKGVTSLEESAFRGAVIKAVDAIEA